MYFDSHCHLTDQRFAGEASAAVERARAAGVTRIVTIASDEEDASEALDLARELGLYTTAGVHPHQASRPDSSLDRVRELLEDPLVVAVGETGLDYYYDNSPRQRQRQLFRRQLELAAETGLPVIVHSREADEDTAALVLESAGEVTGVMHCFAAGRQVFDVALDVGWYVSFSGLVTFRNYDGLDLVAAVPADRLLIETDSPYLAPAPHRGRRNEPAYVVEVARRVAELRGQTVDDVAGITTRNACRFYGLDRDSPVSNPTTGPQ